MTIAARAWSVLRSPPRSNSHATWWVSARFVAISAAESASMAWIIWRSISRAPPCSRCRAHSAASERARSAAPIVRAPIIRRSSVNQSRVSS